MHCWKNSTRNNPRAPDEHTGHRFPTARHPDHGQATLAAGAACLCLAVTEEAGNLWPYNLSETRISRLAYGKIIVPGHMAALCRAAQICAGWYQPGSIERGLLEQFAADHAGS